MHDSIFYYTDFLFTDLRLSRDRLHDFYDSPLSNDISNTPLIGENCIIDHAIIDKNVHIGKNVQLINKDKLMNYSSEKICIRDGIIIVPRGTHLPDGFIL